MLKRSFDIAISALLLLVLLPVIALVFLVIRVNMGSPVLFRQTRPGLNGKPFVVYKFRTMSEQVDDAGDALPDGMRLTGLGRFLRKTSLDEIPQLLNVLNGSMSLVGPRPLLMEYLPLYSSGQAKRHLVRPGITGWAQVHGRNTISWQDKFSLDVWYVENASFMVDMKILSMTLLKVLRRDGINASNAETMKKFTGNP
ncbi:sugar transferase [Polynucleobacter paneuropaeus]|jgi:sugar transferase EpsL|uniref:sugar transferase n=1 Tax=Polynucleobacter paneuropaeus TaxID=2527775 RepID=UPI001BFED4C0|nr:sugar transferase [Polynucleobacter paneuropaeus]MBT8574543.1 sugar transferase [Polynucleobacter paneuropaeus]MBT8585660.1 sugar transferase [Polynucleobacter paneuropaeus]MBT8633220.1 sugar transferase [Polynucleobacter paneuropaeus]